MLETIPVTFRRQEPTEADLEKIRRDAGNPDLAAEDVIVFGKSMIARTDVVANRARFTPEALKTGAASFIGKPLNFDHEYKTATGQVGRIFDAWAEDVGSTTCLLVNSYAIRTAEDADLQKKLFNRQHREQSMGVNILKATCSVCGVDASGQHCPKHSAQADYFRIVHECQGDHVSFVGDEAIPGAGLLTNAKAEPDPALLRLAEDGKTFREWTTAQFSKWYGANNPTATEADITTLAEKLSAREMLTLARIQQSEFTKVIPSGQQQLKAPAPEAETTPPARTADQIKASFKKGI